MTLQGGRSADPFKIELELYELRYNLIINTIDKYGTNFMFQKS